MKKWITGVCCVCLLLLCGCEADPDLILQNGASASESVSDGDTESGSGEGQDGVSADLSSGEGQNGTSAGSSSGGGQDGTSAGSSSDGGDTDESSVICVYICGAVRNPGVYEMAEPARVYQLVELAGGLTEDADEQSVNLAQFAEDGQMIWIPTEEESAAGVAAPQEAESGTASSDSAGEESGKVNINSADISELTTLNGIGETKAAAIVAYREEHGSFQSIEEIMQVSGIAEGTYEKIKDYITV
ncbi:MAG: helix-hairpin-helix domain-containing protein [Lachnospiraceae bacterium]|nr:helix-hairpin-helix domain-containing protein [Lachnospiraceae bacterium]